MNDVEAHLTTQRRSPIWPMLLNEWLPPVSAPATVHRVGYSCLESDRGRVGYGRACHLRRYDKQIDGDEPESGDFDLMRPTGESLSRVGNLSSS